MRLVIGAFLSIFLAACSLFPGGRSEIDRVQEKTIEVGPPAAYLQCDKPVYLTAEQIDKLNLEGELVEIYILPNYKAHKACYENMQDIVEWERKLNQ